MSVKSALEVIKPDDRLIHETEILLRRTMSKKKFSIYKLKFVTAAACLSFMIGALSLYIYQKPVSYLSFDVNPSLELEINRFDRVIDVNFFNVDARNLVSEDELNSLKTAEAVSLIIKRVNEKGYLSSSEASVMTIATNSYSLDKSNQLLNDCISNINISSKSINILSFAASKELKKEADLLSLSFGKLELIKIMQQLDTTITVDDLRDASITTIMNDIYYLTSDECTVVDNITKERVRNYIKSIQTKVEDGIKTSSPIDAKGQDSVNIESVPATQEQAAATQTPATQPTAAVENEKTTSNAQTSHGKENTSEIQETAEAERMKAEASATKTEAETIKQQAEIEAAKLQKEAEATKKEAEAEAARLQAEAESVKQQAETEAAKQRAEAEAVKQQAETEASNQRTEAEAVKQQAETEAAKQQAEAEAVKQQAETEAAKQLAEAETIKQQAEAEAAKLQAEAEALKQQAEAEMPSG